MVAVVRALNSLEALDAASADEKSNLARRVLQKSPGTLVSDLTGRIAFAGTRLAKILSTDPMNLARRLAYVGSIAVNGTSANASQSAAPARRAESTEGNDNGFVANELREIQACYRETRASHSVDSWAARERRQEAIRRYEHRKCRTPCTVLPGVCPALDEPFFERPTWAYSGWYSPESQREPGTSTQRKAPPTSPARGAGHIGDVLGSFDEEAAE